jgi:hypothetical protein
MDEETQINTGGISLSLLWDLFTKHKHDGIGDQKLTIGTSVYAGSGNRTTTEGTGSESVTGVGFKPKAIIFLAWLGGVDKSGWSACFADGTNYAGMVHYYFTDTSNYRHQTVGSQLCLARSGASYDDTGEATLTSFDNDGFTVNWTDVDVTTYYAYLLIG